MATTAPKQRSATAAGSSELKARKARLESQIKNMRALLDQAASNSDVITSTPTVITYKSCLCFEVSLWRCNGTCVTKRFMAPRDIEFPELCERIVATFGVDLRMRRKERGGKTVIKSDFEIAYKGQGCRHCDKWLTPSTLKSTLVLFDTLGLRAMLNEYDSRSDLEKSNMVHKPTNVHKISCTVSEGMCTIL